jgi:hypothetical protein
MHQSLDDSRTSSSWEVNEFGQLVQTQVPAPVQAFEALRLKQLQHQQHLQNQQSFQGQLQSDSQDVYGFNHKASEQPGMKLRAPVNMYESNQLRRERSLSALAALSKVDGVNGMPMELMAQIQEQKQRARAEHQNSLQSFVDAPVGLSELERFHRNAIEMQQVQERQQQVEAAAAVHAQRLSGSRVLEKVDPNQAKGSNRQVSQGLNGAPLSGQNWPLFQPETEALGSHHVWERDTHEYGGQELQVPGRSHGISSSPQEQVPILTTQSTRGALRSSTKGTTPEPLGVRSSGLYVGDGISNPQLGSAMVAQPGWKPPASPRPRLTEMQQEEAERRRLEEKTALDATLRSMSTGSPVGSMGFGPWTSLSSVSQAKLLREIQDEEAYKAATHSVQAGTGALFHRLPSSARQGDIPPGVSSSAGEKGRTPELGNQLLEIVQNKVGTEVNSNTYSQSSAPQLSQNPVAINDSDFVEPKELKKNKKRAAKLKAVAQAGKAPVFTSSGEPHLASTPVGSSQLGKLEASEEHFPMTHTLGPLLAEASKSQEPASTAWSVNSSGQPKTPISLTEIQKAEKQASEEQEQLAQILQAGNMRQGIQVSVKPVLMSRTVSAGASAWQTPPSQQPMSAHRSKTGVFEDDDELFWDTNLDGRRNIGTSKHVLKPERGKNPERGKSGSADITRFLEEDVPGDVENSANNAAGEKKKGKKGKVVDPSLLGFSVTSNRILMGEIQHVED